jgi:hypothetical protein
MLENNTTPTATHTHTLISTLNTLIITGNLNVNSNYNGGVSDNGTFNIASGTVTVNGAIVTNNSNAANILCLPWQLLPLKRGLGF